MRIGKFLNFTKNFFKKLFGNLVFLIAGLIPKDKNLFIFSSWNGLSYKDNPRAIYEYIRDSENSKYVLIWIVKNKKLSNDLNKAGVEAHYYLSLKGLFYQARARVVIFTHSVNWEFYAPAISGNVLRVLTWHGVPIKKVGYDDCKGRSSYSATLIGLIFPHLNDYVDLILTVGPEDARHMINAFNVNPSNVVITGYPRNDILFKPLFKANEKFKVIYLPTLRGGAYSHFDLFNSLEIDLSATDQFFKKNSIELVLKLHPAQRIPDDLKTAISNLDSIEIYEDDDSHNFYGDLRSFDCLICDYSGAYIDYLLTNKPIIMYGIDLKDYQKKSRDLYYDYDEVSPDSICLTWGAVLDKVYGFKIGSFDPTLRYERLKCRFHAYNDDKASLRALKQIEARI